MLTSLKCVSSSEEPLFVTTLQLYIVWSLAETIKASATLSIPQPLKRNPEKQECHERNRNIDVLCRNLVDLAQLQWLQRRAKSKFWQSA